MKFLAEIPPTQAPFTVYATLVRSYDGRCIGTLISPCSSLPLGAAAIEACRNVVSAPTEEQRLTKMMWTAQPSTS